LSAEAHPAGVWSDRAARRPVVAPEGRRPQPLDPLDTPLSEVTFVVLDLETTGTVPGQSRIIEVAAAKYRGGECLGTFQTLVNPGVGVPPFIVALTGITEALVVPAPTIDEVLPTLLEFIGGAVLVGHNLRFDTAFLDADLIARGRPRLANARVDTLTLARRLIRDEVPDCRLATLAARFRTEVRPTHRALDDVLATAEVLHALFEHELLDALDARCTCDAHDADGTPRPARSVVERAHPMQPFGPGAFGGAGEAPRSHDATHLAGALALRAPRGDAPGFLTRELPAPAERVVTVDALAAFLSAPARAVVSGRLGVWLGAPEALEVDDPLDLDGLDRWTLRSDVLARLLDDEDPAPSLALQRAAGRLPHGPLGHVAFGAAVAEARTVTRLAAARAQAVRTDGVDVDRTIGGWRLVGRVGPLFDGGLFEVHAGALRAKQLLSFWVRHLALHLADGPGAGAPASTLVGLPKRTPTDGRLAFAPVPDAEAQLGALLALYDEAMRRPLPLLPDASLAYVEAFTPKRTPEDAHREGLAKAVAAWNDRRDAWTERLLGERPFGDGARFGALSRAVWEPVLACLGARAPEAAAPEAAS
jgi:DNA polymerase III epsilon subunit family exonuclease